MTKPRLVLPMTRRPIIADLFCGAGGCAVGYNRAGFDVVGVDIAPQPHYPYAFHQADALTFPLEGFDAIHASPPCKDTNMIARNVGYAKNWPDLVTPTVARLRAQSTPYVIENPPHRPPRLRADLVLCGCHFPGLNVIRVRWFECSWRPLSLIPRCQHTGNEIGVYGHGTNAWHRAKLGRGITVAEQRAAMGIDWMTRDELTQAIPPAYTEFIGTRLMAALQQESVA